MFTLWVPVARQTQPSRRQRRGDVDKTPRLQGLAQLGGALLREVGPIVTSFVRRLRTDDLFSSSAPLRASQLADHMAAYVADVAGLLLVIGESQGQPSRLLTDASDIQRLIADGHGMRRARLGWTIDALQREWQVLFEEIERALRRVGANVQAAELDQGIAVVRRLIDEAEELSRRALVRTIHAGDSQHSEVSA